MRKASLGSVSAGSAQEDVCWERCFLSTQVEGPGDPQEHCSSMPGKEGCV